MQNLNKPAVTIDSVDSDLAKIKHLDFVLGDSITYRHLGIHGLAGFARERSSRGPAREGAKTYINPDTLRKSLMSDTIKWPGHQGVVDIVSSHLNKMIDREERDSGPVDLDVELQSNLAAKIDTLAEVADYPGVMANIKGLARLVVYMPLERAEHYLGGAFVDELEGLATGVPGLASGVRTFASTNQLLNRASVSTEPDVLIRKATKNAVELLDNDKEELLQLLGEADSRFVDYISKPQVLLQCLAGSPNSYRQLISQSAERFSELVAEFPYLAAADSSQIARKLTNGGLNVDMNKVRSACAVVERKLVKLESRGIPGTKSTYVATRSNKSPEGVIDDAYAPKLGSWKYPGKTHRRLGDAYKRGRIKPDDFGARLYGHDYQEVLLSLDESDMFDSAQKEQLFSGIRDARRQVEIFVDNYEEVLGEDASSLNDKFNERIVSILYAAEYYRKHGEKPKMVPMGSRTIEVSTNPQEILRGLRFLLNALRGLSRIKPQSGAHGDNGVNTELGYAAGTNDEVLIATKLRRDETAITGGLLRGRSPRINFITGMGGVVPSADLHEREHSALSIRLDYDDGRAVLDIGGKTNSQQAPDFVVAKVISLGAYEKSIHDKAAPADYHVALDREMTPDEFSELAMRFRQSTSISQSSLRIPRP